MRIVHILAAAAAVVLVTAGGAGAEEMRRTVSVTGDAEVRVTPDEVLIQMSVESRDKALMTAVEQTNRAVAAVTALARNQIKVPEKNVQTDYISILPHYVSCRSDYESEGKCDPTQVAFYQARRGIEIRLHDLKKLDRLLTESLKGGVTFIDNVEFRTTQLRKHRDQARAMAARAAREKAEAAAVALGAKLGPALTINADTDYWYYGNRSSRGRGSVMAQNAMMEADGGGEGEGAGLALGQISVTARISATFALE